MIKHFSPNMLKTFKLCPKKFEFKYIKQISMPVNDEIFETGKNIHALASYYLRGENIDKMELALNPQEKELWSYLKGLKYLGYECINTEYNLAVKIGKYFFGGRLDALVKNGDKYYILDYKTGSVPKNAIYDFQTMIYLLCVRAFFKTNNVVFVYLDLRKKTEVAIELKEELVAEFEKNLVKISEKIEKGDFSQVCKENHTTQSRSIRSEKGARACEYEMICYY